MGQSPLAPLRTKPLSEEDAQKLALEEKAESLTNLVMEDIEVLAPLVKRVLDAVDPKKVAQLLKSGFEMKISAMQADHAKMQSEWSAKVADGSMQQSEMLIRIKNSDGRIRSMQWFHSSLG